jgi:hypothetical protein
MPKRFILFSLSATALLSNVSALIVPNTRSATRSRNPNSVVLHYNAYDDGISFTIGAKPYYDKSSNEKSPAVVPSSGNMVAPRKSSSTSSVPQPKTGVEYFEVRDEMGKVLNAPPPPKPTGLFDVRDAMGNPIPCPPPAPRRSVAVSSPSSSPTTSTTTSTTTTTSQTTQTVTNDDLFFIQEEDGTPIKVPPSSQPSVSLQQPEQQQQQQQQQKQKQNVALSGLAKFTATRELLSDSSRPFGSAVAKEILELGGQSQRQRRLTTPTSQKTMSQPINSVPTMTHYQSVTAKPINSQISKGQYDASEEPIRVSVKDDELVTSQEKKRKRTTNLSNSGIKFGIC